MVPTLGYLKSIIHGTYFGLFGVLGVETSQKTVNVLNCAVLTNPGVLIGHLLGGSTVKRVWVATSQAHISRLASSQLRCKRRTVASTEDVGNAETTQTRTTLNPKPKSPKALKP